jgi:hypothetical protein
MISSFRRHVADQALAIGGNYPANYSLESNAPDLHPSGACFPRGVAVEPAIPSMIGF